MPEEALEEERIVEVLMNQTFQTFSLQCLEEVEEEPVLEEEEVP